MPFVSPVRSCCSRMTTRSTGRSARTNGPRRTIRIERRCVGVSPTGVQARRSRCRTPVYARSGQPQHRLTQRRDSVARAVTHRGTRRRARASYQIRWRDCRSGQYGERRRAAWWRPFVLEKTGGVLLSQALAGQVPSALRGLTALFGMGRGVSLSLKPPEKGERPASPVLQNCTAPQTSIKKIRQALDPLVPVSFGRCRPSRSGLSTWWSTRGLTPSRGWESSSRGRLPA
jgi:hypothetical protein